MAQTLIRCLAFAFAFAMACGKPPGGEPKAPALTKARLKTFSPAQSWPVGIVKTKCTYKFVGMRIERADWHISKTKSGYRIKVVQTSIEELPPRGPALLGRPFTLVVGNTGLVANVEFDQQLVAERKTRADRPEKAQREMFAALIATDLQQVWQLAVVRWIDLQIPLPGQVKRVERSVGSGGQTRFHETHYTAKANQQLVEIVATWELTGKDAHPFITVSQQFEIAARRQTDAKTDFVKRRVWMEADRQTGLPQRIGRRTVSHVNGTKDIYSQLCEYTWPRGDRPLAAN